MSELSPAAKAVDDAFWKTINDKWNIYDRRRAQLAAALRAAADQLQERKPRPSIGIDWSSSELYAIAAELEAL